MSTGLDNLLLNPKTRAEAEQFIANPTHALLLAGLPGSGKVELARGLSLAVLNIDQLDNYPYFLHLTRPEGKQDIPIENVRIMLRKLQLKTPGTQAVRRVVFIEDAHSLSAEAQNALLKAIEEPADDTLFILSTHSVQAVLPTIASRVRPLQIHPASYTQAREYYAKQYSDKAIENAWQLSQGNVGLLHALLTNQTDHPLRQAVDNAKELLRKNTYERLIELDKISKDKEQFRLFLEALAKVLSALQRGALKRGAPQAGLLASRRLINRMQAAQAANVSSRLIVLELALNLKT